MKCSFTWIQNISTRKQCKKYFLFAIFYFLNYNIVIFQTKKLHTSIFFRADSITPRTLNTSRTTGKSDKRISRTIKIIGTSPRFVGRGELGKKSSRLSCSVWVPLAKRERLIRNVFTVSLSCHHVSVQSVPWFMSCRVTLDAQ